jgi:hypothetical protein
MAVALIPPPDARELLPPLLACLSTANLSKQPPPALLPLLSPILRQRVQLLASDDWLSLLCWDKEAASRLPQVVEKIHVEPHPASGEIEVEDPDETLYRRSDPETLHARLILGEYGIVTAYLWCTGGEKGNRWELAELRGIKDADDGTEWFSDLSEANEAGFRRKAVKTNGFKNHDASPAQEPEQQQEDDDDDYWAAYDRTPSATPHKGPSPAPPTNGRTQVGPTQSELEYFSRYASEVQPAMDPHDPDEEAAAPGESTLTGNSFTPQSHPTDTTDVTQGANVDRRDSVRDEKPSVRTEPIEISQFASLNHPRPSSSASSNSVGNLERQAQSNSQAERAIKQHISTDFKSLFRLARATGIEREEFERLIKRELETLPLLEQDN